ncbi:MAG: Maf family nucleotide pyrophosphatase [Hyphomicrobiales bacterium]|jgi:septum formation protein|nr:Maf family nucleotide pyrophosphatase [Hyphomicrobiales bacterium]
MTESNKLILASNSPRRIELLKQIGVIPDIIQASNIEEKMNNNEKLPHERAIILAREKAESIHHQKKFDEHIVLSADTIVAVGRRIVDKPNNIEEALINLTLLSGRNHRVYTAVCLIDQIGNFHERVVETRIKFKKLSIQETDNYLKSKEWKDKAGGYAIQGIAGSFIIKLIGSYTSVMGLPLYQTANLLNGIGFNVSKNWINEK